jgi:nucleotide-binding universal stress UspA family protein
MQKSRMEEMLSGYNTEFHFIRRPDFLTAISEFSADYQIDLILIVPKKHSFLSNLFSGNHTRKLAYYSHVPVLAIHE